MKNFLKSSRKFYPYLIDFAVSAAACIERQRTDKANNVAKRDCFDLLDFNVDIAYFLPKQQEPEEDDDDDEREIPQENESKRRKNVPSPSPALLG